MLRKSSHAGQAHCRQLLLWLLPARFRIIAVLPPRDDDLTKPRSHNDVVMTGPRRPYPYYKTQILDQRSMAWIERRQGFDTLAEAKEYVKTLSASEKVRIVVVDENGYNTLPD